MPTPANPSASQPTGEPRPAHPSDVRVEPHFGDHLRAFWERNSSAVAIALVVVLVAIVAKGAWDYLQEQRELEIGRAYSAATGQLQLKAFAASHDGHTLAAAALLRVADEVYGDAKYTDAIAPYEQAATILKDGPLASRARLGAAMAKLQGGRIAEGEAAVKAFASDPKEFKALRAEAAYHLATLAFANNRPEDAKAYSEQVLQLDPASPWAQRVIAMRAQLPAGSDPAVKVPAPSK